MLIPSLGGGGAQNVFRAHFYEFSKTHNVFRVVFNKDIVLENKSEILSLEIPAGKNFLQKAYFFLKRIYKLRKIKKLYAIDISISHLNGADYINLFSKGKEKVVCCVHGSLMHNQDMNSFLGKIQKKFLLKFVYTNADVVVPVSKDLNFEIQKHLGISSNKLKTITNFFDISEIGLKRLIPLDQKYCTLFSHEATIVTSGRLESQKNHEPLFEIIKQLQKKLRVKLILLGEGKKKCDLLTHCNSLDLRVYVEGENTNFSNNYDVYFLGFQANPFKFIARSTVFVLPSLWEGFPLALGEAMACEIPVVSANCPTGPREVLVSQSKGVSQLSEPEWGDYGILMPMLNKNSNSYSDVITMWTSVLEKLLRDPTLRADYAGRAKVRINDFSKSKIISEWHQIIEEY